MEAEFFGTAPGAYTGAKQKKRIGKLELANKGTLFLDEVGDMPLAMQVKLLRALQEREIEPLGSNRVTRIDIRVIAATGKDLEAMVSAGEFRADLYYRLNVIPINLPPLRERQGDIPVLCEYLLDEISSKLGRPAMQIETEALSLLSRYHWPGNVRELYNILERAVVLNEGTLVRAAHIRQAIPADMPEELDNASGYSPKGSGRTIVEAIKTLEKQMIEEALLQKQGNKAAAAELLGMPKSTFYMKLKELRHIH
jgi:transcriptional regulator with PAS, ATPase and Fis domain